MNLQKKSKKSVLRESSCPLVAIHQTPCDVALDFASIFHCIQNRWQVRIEIIDAVPVVDSFVIADSVLGDEDGRIVVFLVYPHQ